MDKIIDQLMLGLDIMGRGMAGIFAVIIIIMVSVMIMNRITGSKKDDLKESKESGSGSANDEQKEQ